MERLATGPDRPVGRTNKVPVSFKASFKRVSEEIHSEEPMILQRAIERGLRGKRRAAFPHVQLGAIYIGRKPIERVHVGDEQGGHVAT